MCKVSGQGISYLSGSGHVVARVEQAVGKVQDGYDSAIQPPLLQASQAFM